MATPDPPPNSLGLDLTHPEPAVDSQSTEASPPSPPPQPTTQSSTDTASHDTDDASAAETKPTNVDGATKSNVSKKTPYVNPERVRTGGLPRVNLVSR